MNDITHPSTRDWFVCLFVYYFDRTVSCHNHIHLSTIGRFVVMIKVVQFVRSSSHDRAIGDVLFVATSPVQVTTIEMNINGSWAVLVSHETQNNVSHEIQDF